MSPRSHRRCLGLSSFLAFTTVLICDHVTEARHYSAGADRTAPSSRPSRSYGPPQPYDSARTFDVRSFGAAGDGMKDDSEALLTAWKAACSVESATIEIPSDFMFLIGPVTLPGPCKPNLVLQIDGVILGPSDLSGWPRSGLLQWINFEGLQDFTIRGSGIVNGRGSAWWRRSTGTKPTAIRFYGSHNIIVQDITLQNSPQCHLKFDGSSGILVSKVRISSPENSPNTDGIHLENTKDVEIEDCIIACGDDCISIQTGCSDVHIHGIRCGPGHGISIGSLGIGGTEACVNNITVEDSSIHSATNGVRIKTWAGGRGMLRGVTFSGISVSNVDKPIVIDQFYCDGQHCPSWGDAVSVSAVTFSRITGTYAVQPVYLACSPKQPCTDLTFTGIQLSSASGGSGLQPLCSNAYGDSTAPISPQAIDCLQKGNRLYTASAHSQRPYTCSP
ncbi:polygalacturonase At1g48100-like [Nymphaea colorata]|nr:polygalacturonase At1g48100-like [Nymphaea colorata]